MRFLCVGVLLISSAGMAVAESAAFLGDTIYSSRAGCEKLQKLAKGAPRNLTSVPDTVSASGHQSWEGGCSITKIGKKLIGGSWSVTLRCGDGAQENVVRRETWKLQRDGSLLVTSKLASDTFTPCRRELAR